MFGDPLVSGRPRPRGLPPGSCDGGWEVRFQSPYVPVVVTPPTLSRWVWYFLYRPGPSLRARPRLLVVKSGPSSGVWLLVLLGAPESSLPKGSRSFIHTLSPGVSVSVDVLPRLRGRPDPRPSRRTLVSRFVCHCLVLWLVGVCVPVRGEGFCSVYEITRRRSRVAE